MSEPRIDLLQADTLLVAIDDTDTVDSEYGTGKVSRFLGAHLAAELESLSYRGSVRQQLLVDPRVPYTTHNSAAALLLEWPIDRSRDQVVSTAADFLADIAAEGSDPGLCVTRIGEVTDPIREFGIEAGEAVVQESAAYDLAMEADVFLEEYGGTGEGVIGALAAVGRTTTGKYGRFIDLNDVRSFEGVVTVSALQREGVTVRTTAGVGLSEGEVETGDWVRPELRNGEPTLEVTRRESGLYRPTNLDD